MSSTESRRELKHNCFELLSDLTNSMVVAAVLSQQLTLKLRVNNIVTTLDDTLVVTVIDGRVSVTF